MKNEKGITLVALVLTIVVLLILAGVTVFMVIGLPKEDTSNTNIVNTTVQPTNENTEEKSNETTIPTNETGANEVDASTVAPDDEE